MHVSRLFFSFILFSAGTCCAAADDDKKLVQHKSGQGDFFENFIQYRENLRQNALNILGDNKEVTTTTVLKDRVMVEKIKLEGDDIEIEKADHQKGTIDFFFRDKESISRFPIETSRLRANFSWLSREGNRFVQAMIDGYSIITHLQSYSDKELKPLGKDVVKLLRAYDVFLKKAKPDEGQKIHRFRNRSLNELKEALSESVRVRMHMREVLSDYEYLIYLAGISYCMEGIWSCFPGRYDDDLEIALKKIGWLKCEYE